MQSGCSRDDGTFSNIDANSPNGLLVANHATGSDIRMLFSLDRLNREPSGARSGEPPYNRRAFHFQTHCSPGGWRRDPPGDRYQLISACTG
jgi:hypothetical protein